MKIDERPILAIVLLALYIFIDVADARWFIPHMRDRCKGAMTEQQENVCYHWIYLKGETDGHNR